MVIKQYRFKFYLNARHAMNTPHAKIHPHTWEIVLHVIKMSNDFVLFSKIEKDIELFLSKYEGKFLNETYPFDLLEPTMENIGEVFQYQINGLLTKSGWQLQSLEISENPARTYIISTGDTPLIHDEQMPSGILDLHAFAEGDQSGLLSKKIDTANGAAGNAISETAAAEDISDPAENYEKSISADLSENDNTADDINSIEIEEKSSDAAEEITSTEITEEAPVDTAHKGKLKYVLISLAIIIAAAVLTLLWITRSGPYPWGSDAWGHIFKGDLLYKEIKQGNFYPLYTEYWYNGVQPFRYWAPLPYYLLAFFEMLTSGNIALSYNLFVGFVFVAGAMGWVLWGIKANRRNLALILGLLWFFLPDNLRVLLSDGNLPRVVVTMLFPYFLFCVWDYLENKNLKALPLLSFIMLLITLSHVMIAAIVGVTLFIYLLWYGTANDKLNGIFKVLISAILGILMAGIWLYPSLRGGMFSIDQDAIKEVVKLYTYPITQSLNPFARLNISIESFYYGLSIMLISIFGFIFSKRKSKPGFGITIMIFIGTTPSLLPIILKLPMSQLFWMWRFTPMAMAIFFSSLLAWRTIKRKYFAIILLLLIVDSAISFKVLGHGVSQSSLSKDLNPAINLADQRIGMVDLSEYGSYPSYYLSNNGNKDIMQVFGWAWQGATTAPNITQLNTALEKGWYSFLFDRYLELGADTLVVRKSTVKEMEDFLAESRRQGYNLVSERIGSLVLKYPVNDFFGTKPRYIGLGIGKYSENMAYIFPRIEIGRSIYIDDYTEDELLNYKVIYLSGFAYHDKSIAEELVKRLSQKGVKIIVDMTGVEEDLFTSRADFLGVVAQPVEFRDKYPLLKVNNESIELGEMPEDNRDWRTHYLENLDTLAGSTSFQGQEMAVIGTKINNNIIFLGFNIPYFTVVTKDTKAISILEKILGIEAFETPVREIVEINVVREGNKITVDSPQEGVITGIAAIDGFKAKIGSYETRENLVALKGKHLELQVGYPLLITGSILSIIGVLFFLLLLYLSVFKQKKNQINLIYSKGNV